MRNLLFSILTMIGFSGAALAMPAIGQPAPDFTAKDIAGNDVTLSALKGKIVVLEWTNPECPFVKKFYNVDAMQKLQADMQAKDIVWISINSSAKGKGGNLSADAAKKYIADNKATPNHYMADEEGVIGTLYAAKTTPHMYVIDAKGNLAYMGAIDDKATADSADITGAKNYVRVAVDSLSTGKTVEVPSTQAYGCTVKYKS